MTPDDKEIHLYRCEVRFVCSLSSSQARTAFLAEVAKRRGRDAADKLRADAREQYSRGNRGAAGDWRE